MPMNGNFGMFGLPKRPIGTGGVFNGQFDNDPMAQPQQQMQPQNKRWLEGGKFGWKDGLALALGAIGDARTGRPMTSQLILGSYQQRKQAEERQKLMEQQRQAGLEDYGKKLQMEQQYKTPKGPEIGVFEDNAGNRWRYDKATGQVIDESPSFVDRATRQMIQDGALINVPNPYLSQTQGQSYGEGTVIENDNGERMVLRNGQWVRQ
jgi:hypothetical protein